MDKIDNKCSQCKNSSFCKFVESYKKVIDDISSLMQTIENNDYDISFLKLNIDCKHYTETTFLNRSLIELTDNPCATCLNKPDFDKGYVVGDTVCDWCSKNPWRPTWKLTSTKSTSNV